MTFLLAALLEGFRRHEIEFAALGLAWARAMPTVVLVPAFGLKALPRPTQAFIALALALSVWPALVPAPQSQAPWMVAALVEILRGVPIAIAAAVPLWAATMAGGIADALRGSQDAPSFPLVDGRTTPLAIPLSLLACAIFLHGGGPARVA